MVLLSKDIDLLKETFNILRQFQHTGCPGETILEPLGVLWSTWAPKCEFLTISVLHFDLLLAPLEVTFFILGLQGHTIRGLFEVIVVRSLF